MNGDVGIRCDVVGMTGKHSKVGDDLCCRLWLEELSLDAGYIGFGGRLCLVRSGGRGGIMITDDDRASDDCRFLGTLFGRSCSPDHENRKCTTSLGLFL